MNRVIRSSHILAVNFPPLFVTDAAGNVQYDPATDQPVVRMPGVTLPRGTHTRREHEAGMTAYRVVTEEELARLNMDSTFRAMLRRGDYALLSEDVHEIPVDALPVEAQRQVRVVQLEQQNARLRSELRKHDIAVPEVGDQPAPVAAPEVVDVVHTDVSLPAEPEDLAPARPAFGADTRITLPGSFGVDVPPGYPPPFAGTESDGRLAFEPEGMKVSSLDRFVGTDRVPLTSVNAPRPGRKPEPTRKSGEPDRIVGKLSATRETIVQRMKDGGILCETCAGTVGPS